MKKHTVKEKIDLVKQVDAFRLEGFKVKGACKKAGVSDVSYYLWRKESSENAGVAGPENPREQKEEPEHLLDPPKPLPASKIKEEDQTKVLEIKACFPHMGVKQLRQHLIRNHKITYSERQIRQLLKKEGVPQIRPAFEPKPVRRFEREQPNEMWQIDIMSFYIGSKCLYLTSFLDDYSRFIVSYSVTEEQTSRVVLDLLNRGISFRKPLCIITDRGIQFSSWNGVTAFQLRLNALNIDHIQASEQHPQTMGKIERFHKTIQTELLTTTEFSSIEEAKNNIHDYIMFYNFARPHMGIDNKAPAERYFNNLLPFNHESVYYKKVVPRPGSRHESSRRNQTPEGTVEGRKDKQQGAGKAKQSVKDQRDTAHSRHRSRQ